MRIDGDTLWFEMDFGDGKGFREVSLNVLEKIPDLFDEELTKVLQQAAEVMLQDLWAMFRSVVRNRPRVEGANIKDVIVKALEQEITRVGPVIALGVFNLELARQETSGPEWDIKRGSVFEALEEGYEVRYPWGFMPKKLAERLAEEAAQMLPEGQRLDFKVRISNAFFGRHGDGIMVNVEEPLFFEVPEFGTPLEFGILPHRQWEGWHVLEKISGPAHARAAAAQGEDHWLLALLDKAMANTLRRVQTI